MINKAILLVPLILSLFFISIGCEDQEITNTTTPPPTITAKPTAIPTPSATWQTTKENTVLQVALTDEYLIPYKQDLSVLGWEDGIHISRDGLNLYCVYLPADFLSFITSGDGVDELYKYKRGPDFGMDLATNPLNNGFEWIHADILCTHRNSMSEPFSNWQLAGISRSTYSEGAPNPIFSDKYTIDIMVFTSNDSPTYTLDIWTISNTSKNPVGIGEPLPEPLNSEYNEDNPHMERLDSSNLVVFFDSDNKPGNKGEQDIWFSTSSDNGVSWSIPQNVTSINTTTQEIQPHLYKDTNDQWYLYFTTMNTDGKLGVFRSKQLVIGDWNSWADKELVIGAGNTAGVGEATLTEDGSISFVVVYENADGTETDRFDADPWFLPKK